MNKLINTEVRGPPRRRVEKKTRKERTESGSNIRINETQEERNVKRERENEYRNRERRVKKMKIF